MNSYPNPFDTKLEIDSIRTILDEKHFNDALEAMQREYSLINRNGKVFIVNEDKNSGELVFTTAESFTLFFKHLSITKEVPRSTKLVTEELAQAFLKNSDTNRLKGIIFDPSKKSGVVNDYYNLWKGWSVEPKEGDVSRFLKLVEVNANYKKENVEYFLNYCAHAVQKPKNIPMTSIVIKGAPGSGKGTLINDSILPLNKNSKHITDANMITGNFNGHLADSYMVCIDEVLFGGNHQEANKFKTFISESKRMINDKMKTAYTVYSYTRSFILSNNDYIVKVEDGDRRYVIFEANDELKNNFTFFNDYQNWIKGDGLANILHYLLNIDISNFNPLEIPHTEEKVELQLMALDLPKRFMFELCNGSIDFKDKVKVGGKIYRSELYKQFVEFVKQNTSGSFIPSSTDFGRLISKMFNFKDSCENWKLNWRDTNGYYYLIATNQDYMQKCFAENILRLKAEKVFGKNEEENEPTFG